MYSSTRRIMARCPHGSPLMRPPVQHHGIRRDHVAVGLLGEPYSLTVQLSSELVHLRGRRGHPSRARTEVGVDCNGPADGEDTAQAVTVVSDTVTHGKHLVRRDRIAGSVE